MINFLISTMLVLAFGSEPECLKVKLGAGQTMTKDKVPQDMSEIELISRLAYAETQASRCTDITDGVYSGILHVIINRVKQFEAAGEKDAVRRTVFGQSQFASSLHSYPQSRWQDFACPRDQALFAKIQTMATDIRAGKTPHSFFDKATHYYLHRHFGKMQKHPWGSKAKSIAKIGDRSCLVLYKVDNGFLKATY